jgi:MFS family permease
VTLTASKTVATPTGQRGLIACLAFAALTGSVVAGLGSPIVLEVSTQRHVSIASAQWTLIITLLVGVVGTPVLSRLADGRLRRGVLIGALLTVSLGALVGALVPTFPGLLTVSIARERLQGHVLDRTLGVLSTSIAVGVGLGNPIMGLCVKLLDYRAAFAFAFVVSTIGAIWVWRKIPVVGEDVVDVDIDLPGALLLGGGLAAVLLAIARGEVWGWSSWQVLVLSSVSVAVLATWSLVELKIPAPLVDLRLTCARGNLGVNVAAVLLGVCVFGGVSAVILLIQRPVTAGLGLGHSVFVTGLLMTPMAVATLVSPPVARWLARRTDVRLVLPVGSLVVAASFGTFAVLHDRTWHIALMMGVMGVGIGVAYSIMPALIVARTPVERTASATGVNQVLRLMGGAVGAAVVTAVLAGHTPFGATQPVESGYVVAALLATGAGVLAAVVGYLLVPPLEVPIETVDTYIHPD